MAKCVCYNKVLFHIFLLLLGQNKSFVIPRTSLYRCSLYWGSTVVVKVNKIFQPLVLYDWPNDNDGTSTFSVCMPFVCFLIFFASVIFKIDYIFKVMWPSRIEFPFFAHRGEGEIIMSPIWISKPIFSCVEVAMTCWYFNIVLCFSEYSRLASHMVQWAFWIWSDSCVIQNLHAGRQGLWPFDSFQNRVSADQNHMAQL